MNVFISYSWDDESHKENVRALAESLRNYGINVVIDQFVPPNEIRNFPGWMTEQITQADYVLIVCTERYHEVATNPSKAKSSGVLFESVLWYNDVYYDADKIRKYVPIIMGAGRRDHVPLLLRGCPSYRLSVFTLNDQNYDLLLRHLTNQPYVIPPPVGKIPNLPPKAPAFRESEKPPGPKPNNLPYPSLKSLFVGREKVLNELRDSYVEAKKSSPESPVFQVVHALGGIGKTRLAVEYAWKFADQYEALLFVGGNDLSRLIGDLAGLAGPNCLALGLPDDMLPRDKANRVLSHLRNHRDWLLIIDNVDDETAASHVEKLLGDLSVGHVLITSRWRGWNDQLFQVLALDLLDLADARDLILKSTEKKRAETPDDVREAEGLATDLGRLSLALQQAAAYIKASPSMSIAEYRERWQKKFRELAGFKKSYLYNTDEGGELLTILTTWQTTFDRLSPSARWWMDHLAFLSPEPIPNSLAEELHKLDPSPEKRDWNAPESAVAELQSYSLLNRLENAFPNIGQMHRLVQMVVREGMEESEKNGSCENVASALVQSFSGDPREHVNWARHELLSVHIAALFALLPLEITDFSDNLSWLGNQSGSTMVALARFEEAELLYRRALSISEMTHGPDHSEIGRGLNNLAFLLSATNRLSEAKPLYLRALRIARKSYGPDHPHVVTIINNLAELLRVTGRYKISEPLYRRALSIYEMTCVPDHPDIARGLNNLAGLLRVTNRFSEAEPLFRRSLSSYEKWYGLEHPEVARSLNTLADLLRITNRSSEAEPLIKRSLSIAIKRYSPDHPEIARILVHLGILFTDTARYAEAELHFRRALSILGKAYGPDHPELAKCISGLAQLMEVRHWFKEAELMHIVVLRIHEKSFGPDHPDVATSLSNLARLLSTTNRLSEAEPLFRRALLIFENSYGPDHSDVATCLDKLAGLLVDTNRHFEAEQLYTRALSIAERSFGSDHPDVAVSLNNLAGLLCDMNRHSEAEKYYNRAVLIAEKSYGLNHPNVAAGLNNLARVLMATNRLSEAESHFRRSLSIVENSLGPNHFQVAITLNNLADLLRVTKRLSEAEPLLRRAAKILLCVFGPNHPNSVLLVSNYGTLLQENGFESARIVGEVVSICTESGVDPNELFRQLQKSDE
jgi:tetratricopeptide (TPR) repeat protein